MPSWTHTSDRKDATAEGTESSAASPQPDTDSRGRSRRRTIPWLLAVLAVVIVVIAGTVVFRKDSSGSWKTVWADNFSGTSGTAPSSANWKTDTGTSYPGGAAQWGTGETETYTDSRANLALDGHGDLKITATRNGAGVWNSGRIETQQTGFQPAAGQVLKVQARIQTPAGGAGYWPAFWMLGAPFRGVYTNWPGIGEIDIMENSGGAPSTVHGTFHCGVTPGGPCNENNGLGGKHTGQTALSAGFHTYTVEWDRTKSVEEIRWYVDGTEYYSVKSSQVPAATWANATHHGFFVLLNLAIGGSFPGPTAADTKSSGSMLVDYVKVSRR